jgi:hypothetical protein
VETLSRRIADAQRGLVEELAVGSKLAFGGDLRRAVEIRHADDEDAGTQPGHREAKHAIGTKATLGEK